MNKIAIAINNCLTITKVVVVLALMLAGLGASEIIIVRNAGEFNALQQRVLNPGDRVVLKSGTYGALQATLTTSISSDSVAQSNPVLIYAEEPGKVVVNKPSEINLAGKGITIAGFNFVKGSGMRYQNDGDEDWIFHTEPNSRYMTISNMRFYQCNALKADGGSEDGIWIFVQGFNHVIEYCSFVGKDEPVLNATVAFKRDTKEAGVSTPRNHQLRYCYFGPRKASKTANGYETIRIGDSKSQAHLMAVRVEYNVFDRSLWRSDGAEPNDLEIISSKSRGNTISRNTFLRSFGQITLRHGDECVVDGNYIFGSGYYSQDGKSILLESTPNVYQGGIRVIGKNHTISNNYLINLAGTNLRSALCVQSGENGFVDGNGSGGSNGYEVADGARIFNNTFINCRQTSLGYKKDSDCVLLPKNLEIYNNVWQSRDDSKGIILEKGFGASQIKGSAKNYVYQPKGIYGTSGLDGVVRGTYTSTTSPLITEAFEQFLIPASNSPLLGAADSTLVAKTDITGLTRPASGKDIGCFERGLSGEGYLPMLRDEVGPVFDGGPAGTYLANVPETPAKLVIAAANVLSSGDDGHVASNVVDQSLLAESRWSSKGDGQWIQLGWGASKKVTSVKIAWHKGNVRQAKFDLLISNDGVNWATLLQQKTTSGSTLDFEIYDVADTAGQFVKIVGYGNSDGGWTNEWNSITEVEVYGVSAK